MTPSATTVREGETVELTVTMSPAPQAPQELTYTIGTDGDEATADADADDYTGSSSGVVTIPAGVDEAESSTAVISIAVTDDSNIDEGAREVMVVRLAPSGAARSADSGGVLASAVVTIHEGICDRTPAVRDAILGRLGLGLGLGHCYSVTFDDLHRISGELNLSDRGIVALQGWDFAGLLELDRLRLENNRLTLLPDRVFEGLLGLEELYLQGNQFNPGPDATLRYELVRSGRFGFFATVRESAPFDISLTLSSEGGTPYSLEDGSSLPAPTIEIPAGIPFSKTVRVKDIDIGEVAKITATMGSFAGVPAENYNGISADVGIPLPMVAIPAPPVVSFKETTPEDSSNPDSVLEGETATYTVTARNLEMDEHIWVPWRVTTDGINNPNVADPYDFPGAALPSGTVHLIGKGDGEEVEGMFDVPINHDIEIDAAAREYFLVTLESTRGHHIGPVASWKTSINEGVCDRTGAVQTAVLKADELSDRGLGEDCSAVTDEDLASLTTSFALNDSGIGTLEPRDLIGMTNLEFLRLDGNSLTDLPDGLFSDQALLSVLNLRHNELRDVRSGMWTGPDALRGLLLSNNKLGAGTLSADDFEGLGTLKTLWLDGNNIRTLPNDVFEHLDGLSHLNLGYNLLSDVPSGTFSNVTNLQRLDLDGNSIGSVGEGAFQSLSSLAYLDLQLNDMYRLSPGMFSGLSKLRSLDLYGNWLHSFNVVAELKGADGGVRVKVAEAAPFKMKVTLSAVGGTLSTDWIAVEAGQKLSDIVTVTTSDGGSVTVAVESVVWGGTAFGTRPVPGAPLIMNP